MRPVSHAVCGARARTRRGHGRAGLLPRDGGSIRPANSAGFQLRGAWWASQNLLEEPVTRVCGELAALPRAELAFSERRVFFAESVAPESLAEPLTLTLIPSVLRVGKRHKPVYGGTSFSPHSGSAHVHGEGLALTLPHNVAGQGGHPSVPCRQIRRSARKRVVV